MDARNTTPDSVKLWINTVFHTEVTEVCSRPETQALLKVGHERGHDVGTILRNIVAAVVLEIARMDPDEW